MHLAVAVDETEVVQAHGRFVESSAVGDALDLVLGHRADPAPGSGTWLAAGSEHGLTASSCARSVFRDANSFNRSIRSSSRKNALRSLHGTASWRVAMYSSRPGCGPSS